MRPEQKAALLEAALIEIAEIAELSDGPVAKFYGMLARSALNGGITSRSQYPLTKQETTNDIRGI